MGNRDRATFGQTLVFEGEGTTLTAPFTDIDGVNSVAHAVNVKPGTRYRCRLGTKFRTESGTRVYQVHYSRYYTDDLSVYEHDDGRKVEIMLTDETDTDTALHDLTYQIGTTIEVDEYVSALRGMFTSGQLRLGNWRKQEDFIGDYKHACIRCRNSHRKRIKRERSGPRAYTGGGVTQPLADASVETDRNKR
jgi:hypothetical protein